MAEYRVIDEQPEAHEADLALADVPVAVAPAAERDACVIGVNDGNAFQADC